MLDLKKVCKSKACLTQTCKLGLRAAGVFRFACSITNDPAAEFGEVSTSINDAQSSLTVKDRDEESLVQAVRLCSSSN